MLHLVDELSAQHFTVKLAERSYIVVLVKCPYTATSRALAPPHAR